VTTADDYRRAIAAPDDEFSDDPEARHRQRIEERLERFIQAVEDNSVAQRGLAMSIDALDAAVAAQTTAITALTAAAATPPPATQAQLDATASAIAGNTTAIEAATASLTPAAAVVSPVAAAFVQGTNPDGSPMVDANGVPVDANGNPAPAA
jgi:hypothetical protein